MPPSPAMNALRVFAEALNVDDVAVFQAGNRRKYNVMADRTVYGDEMHGQ